MSFSKFLGELFRRQMHESREYETAMRRYLSKKPALISTPGEPYPRREKLYVRVKFR